MIQRKAVIMPILVILSVQGVIGSILFFQKESDRLNSYLISETGKVAGIEDNKIVDLTKEIPIMPDAEIVSVDTSYTSAAITTQIDVPHEQIQTYYDDHMLLNDWVQTGTNIYQKDNKQLEIEITEDIVKLTLKQL